MRAESTRQPEAVAIERCGARAQRRLPENVTQEQRESGTVYVDDEYLLTAPWRDGLPDEVTSRREAWLQRAKAMYLDSLARGIREKRDALLKACDWTQTGDAPLGEARQEAWRTYRQLLRDVPQQAGFPYTVVWPGAPAEEET